MQSVRNKSSATVWTKTIEQVRCFVLCLGYARSRAFHTTRSKSPGEPASSYRIYQTSPLCFFFTLQQQLSWLTRALGKGTAQSNFTAVAFSPKERAPSRHSGLNRDTGDHHLLYTIALKPACLYAHALSPTSESANSPGQAEEKDGTLVDGRHPRVRRAAINSSAPQIAT